MGNIYVRVKVSGEFACFTRPENKVERVSYECMTPSSARNILDAICWKPEMRWVVTQIAVLKPITYQGFRRNELQSKVAPHSVASWMEDAGKYKPQPAGAGTEDATPRNTLALRDVAYVIEAYPLVYRPNAEDTATKYMAMFNRRVENGQCYSRPSLGCREFAASFEPVSSSDRPISESIEIGNMLYDVIFRNAGKSNRAVFFAASIVNGVLGTDPARVLPAELREELLACSYRH